MNSKIVTSIGIAVAGVLIALFFIPTNEFYGTDSYNRESPPPIVVLSNAPDDFEINPTGCSVKADTVEFEFNVVNKLSDDYRLEIHLVLNNENEQNLSREAILLEVDAEKTVLEKHQTPYNPDMKTCQIELKRTEKISGRAMDSETLSDSLQKNEPVLIVDIRDAQQYMNNHIDGSSHDTLDSSTLQKRMNTIQNKLPNLTTEYKFIIVDQDETSSRQAAQHMFENGFNAYYLKGGVESWTGQFSTKFTPTTITSDELYQQMQGNEEFYLLDVREPSELETTMISGSKNIPLADIFSKENISEIPNDKPVVVICGSGNRATIASYELAKYGIDFQVLEGGIKSWDDYLEENNLPKQ